ncbi:MAG: DUF6263 family protein [Mariniblastus sp.]|nr:DUF6263 family protein [Mariniblastus sp.]
MKNITFGPIVVAILFLSLSQAPAQTEALQWKLEKDDRFKATLVQTSQAKTKVNSRETSIDNSTTLVMDWKVIGRGNDGTATIEQSIVSIKLAVANPAIPAQAVKFDSAAKDDVVGNYSKSSKILLRQIKPLIGLKFIVEMLPTGEIQNVVLPPETATAINQLPETVRLRKLFSKQGINEILGDSSIVFPTQGLSPDESWTVNKQVDTPFGKFTHRRIYTLGEPKTIEKNKSTTINITAAMIANPEATSLDSTLQGKLVSFAGSGELSFDIDGGFLKTSSFSNQLKTERPYREKNIETIVNNTLQLNVTKK